MANSAPVRATALAIFLAAPLLLTGCDEVQSKLGIEDAAAKATRIENEGKAIGGACRQSGRAIEDCYSLYQWVPKAAVYTGWREMDAYMRENQLQTVSPELPRPRRRKTRAKRRKSPSHRWTATAPTTARQRTPRPTRPSNPTPSGRRKTARRTQIRPGRVVCGGERPGATGQGGPN